VYIIKFHAILRQPEFRNDISSHGWVITISSMENERPPYWNSILPVSVLTWQSSSASQFVSAHQISYVYRQFVSVVITSLTLSRWRPLTSRINFRLVW